MKGIELCRAYFEAEGMPMLKRLEKQYPELRGKLAAGLVGQGSECLGFDIPTSDLPSVISTPLITEGRSEERL